MQSTNSSYRGNDHQTNVCVVYELLINVVKFLIKIKPVQAVFGREAACTPLASSIIADYFITQQRALALGFYNWGIYIGYSMSYAVGNFVTLSLVLLRFCFTVVNRLKSSCVTYCYLYLH